jgi:hypothetical protein
MAIPFACWLHKQHPGVISEAWGQVENRYSDIYRSLEGTVVVKIQMPLLIEKPLIIAEV